MKPTRILLLATVLSAGCGIFGKKEKEPEAPEATLPSWLGRVVMVDAAHRFALVDTGAPVQLAPGARLLSFRDQRRTASLLATADIKPPFLALEITEGMPATGDQVALDESHPPEAMPAD
ncbi:MAG: hypothetical protein IAE97_09640 [Chthoniobacterales bacterium]|nr:hypothetical protein [Chthoniobacterales bacterium]